MIDKMIDNVDDTLGAALFAADAACQLENVLTLTRRQGAPHGLVTSPELAHPVVVAFPRCRGDRPQRVTGRTLVPCARADPTPKLTAWTLSELVDTDFLPPEFVVYGLLPVGLSNLAGRPKVGKSLLANQIAVAIDAGCEVLGRAVRQSPVFYLALEDSPSRLSARLKKLIQARGIAIPPPAGGLNTVLDASIDDQTCGIGYSVGSAAAANSSTGSIGSSKFVIGCRLLGEGGLEQIESVFAEGFGVAVIDTFSRACGRADQNDSADMTMLMGALQRMALDHHAAILLVDHHRKSARTSPDTDPIDDIMGSTAKAGVVDCALGLYRRHNEAEGLLKLSGRDFGDAQIPLTWDAESFTWQLRAGGEGDDGSEPGAQAPLPRFTARDYATIAAVEELGPATLTQIMAVTGEAKGNLYNRLAALCRRGALIRRGCGEAPSTPPPDEPPADPQVPGVMERYGRHRRCATPGRRRRRSSGHQHNRHNPHRPHARLRSRRYRGYAGHGRHGRYSRYTTPNRCRDPDSTTLTAITTITSCADLFTLISRDTHLRRTAATNGGEYSAPCPLCRRGTDRLQSTGAAPRRRRTLGLPRPQSRPQRLRQRRRRHPIPPRPRPPHLPRSPRPPRHRPGNDNRRGMRSGGNRPVVAANISSAGPCALPPSHLHPPLWQTRATQFAARCALLLWEDEGARALAYLHARGIQDATLRAFHVGYNPEDLHDDPAAWGLPHARQIRAATHLAPPRHHLPLVRRRCRRGPGIWRLNIRRPLSPAQIARGEPKYLGPRGFANALYNAGALGPDPAHALPAVLVEGELDALTIVQAAGDLVAAVATGSTAGARCLQWIARLAQAPRVLVAFDVDPVAPTAPRAPATPPPPGGWTPSRVPSAGAPSSTTSTPPPRPPTSAPGSSAA